MMEASSQHRLGYRDTLGFDAWLDERLKQLTCQLLRLVLLQKTVPKSSSRCQRSGHSNRKMVVFISDTVVDLDTISCSTFQQYALLL